jgi:hypothetical protein
VAVEARLADVHQCESKLEADQVATPNHEERQLPTFARASQNVAAVVVLLDMLSAPSTDGVGMVYQQLKNILGTTAVQQAESTLQHRVKASISTPNRSKVGG